MLKKIFTIILVISCIYIIMGNIDIRHLTEEDQEYMEEKGVILLNNTIEIAKEIDNFGQQNNLNKNIIWWSQTQNQIIRTSNQILNFIFFPITLSLNLINLLFNCVSILTGVNYRTNISTSSIFYTGDFTNGTSYGGGGGGFRGGS